MASGTARLQLLLELKNRLKGGLSQAKTQVDKAAGGMQSRLSQFAAAHGKMLGAIKDQVPGLGAALGMLSNPYALAAAGAAAAAAAIVKCTQAAIEWEKSMADIQVTAQLTKGELEKLSDDLKGMGTQYAVELEDVPKAFSMILGAVNDLAGSKDLLAPTLMASKALGASLETTAQAMSSVFASTGYEGKRVGDLMAQTLIDGAVGFEEIAQFFPKILPNANALGLKLEEVTGAFAALTGKVGARMSATSLDALFGELQSAEKVKKLEKIGVNVFDKEGSMRSLQDIAKDFKKQFDGLTDRERSLKFSNLGMTDNAAKAILSLTQNYDDLVKSTKNAVNSEGALKKAYENSLTAADTWKIVQNNLKVGMINIGELFLPILKKAGLFVMNLIEKVKQLWNENQILRDRVAMLGKVFKVAFTVAIIPIKRLFESLKFIFNIINTIVSKVGEFVGKATGLGNSFSEMYANIRPYLLWIYNLLSQIGDIAYKISTFKFSEAWDSMKNFKMPSIEQLKASVVAEVETANNPAQIEQEDMGQKTEDQNVDATKITEKSQTKTVNMTIGNVVENWQTLSPEFKNMGKNEVETYLTGIITRVMQSIIMTK